MLFWTTGNAPFLFFQIIVMVLWFINIAEIVTCRLWVNVNSGFFIFLHWNPCIAGKHRWPFYWPRTTGNQTFLCHIWLLVDLKFLLSWVERICRLIITTSPTDLKACILAWCLHFQSNSSQPFFALCVKLLTSVKALVICQINVTSHWLDWQTTWISQSRQNKAVARSQF